MHNNNNNSNHIPNSPLFPPSQLSTNSNHDYHHSQSQSQHRHPSSSNSPSPPQHQVFLPTLPDKPTTATSSLAAYIIPSEPVLFVQGFEPHEYESRPPTLLRGSLYIRVFKPTKIKSITLSFKGVQRTDWPEGIPPKKNVYNEQSDIITHTWPFFQASSTSGPIPNNGADIFVEKNGETHRSSLADDLSAVRSNTPPPAPQQSLQKPSTSGASSIASSSHHNDNFFTRNLSPSFIRKSKSPAPSSSANESSSTFTDLTSIVSPSNNDPNSSMLFNPGDYLYNFEHPLPPSIPESCSVTFGSTSYHLEVSIQRLGTFKSNLSGRLPITIVRTPSELNMEENESIVISRDWEDQIKYDIVIGAKSVVLDSYLPLAFRFVPLWGKVALHRIRIYLTENLEYYCCNKKVHRMEPPKKFLLLEHKARKGRSLLQKNPQDESTVGLDQYDEDVLPKELEFQLFVPKNVIGRLNSQIHPDTSYENIQSHHWIKICLRISKIDPDNSAKRKHYEISIDSPIHVLSPLAAHNNTLLPAYDDLVDTPPPQQAMNGNNVASVISPSVNPLSPEVIAVDGNSQQPIEFHHISTDLDVGATERDADMHLEANLYKPKDDSTITTINSPQAKPHPETFTSPLMSPVQRPIHLIRKPSTAPPPFEESAKSPPVMSLHPPAYGDIQHRDGSSSDSGSRGGARGRGGEGSLSLSPLRIDDEVGQNFVNPLTESGTTSVENSTGLQVNTVTPVRDLLIQQLQGNGGSHAETEGEHTSNSETSRAKTDVVVPEISINGADVSSEGPTTTSKHSTEDGSTLSNSVNNHLATTLQNNNNSMNQLSLDDAVINDNDEGDIADDPHSPISPRLVPISFAHRRSSRGTDDMEGLDNEISSFRGKKQRGDDATVPLSPQESRSSRSSSISTTNSFEPPIDQTLPLLNMSTSSIHPTQADVTAMNGNAHSQVAYSQDDRNPSISSSIYDLSQRRPSQPLSGMKPMGIISDYISAHDDEFYQLNSLHHLRNPRIKKHYQDEAAGEDEEEGDLGNPNSATHSTGIGGNESGYKTRQKSFGVVGVGVGNCGGNFNEDEYEVEEGSSLSSNEVQRQVHGHDQGHQQDKNDTGGGDSRDSKVHSNVQDPPPGMKVGFVMNN
ncbi:hypothetical protein CANMA_003386 [Candida margitis]|uniref:uncharacterized protein n=1 Tax=Candida margitis TaxID=1775924 RepID=UPI0022279CBE|nr:uncharacterized protein CANMA_003386 [Candida margitis]KAI5966001.1 hypothetical protein CANMA_003386 [Candida margitis]